MLQPWYVRSRSLRAYTGAAVFQALYGPSTERLKPAWQHIATLLESPYPYPIDTPQSRLSRYSICAGPPRRQKARPLIWTPPIGDIFAMLSNRLATPQPTALLLTEQGKPLEEKLEPFAGGWLGWLGYDLAWEIEGLPTLNPDPLPFPVAFWYEPETFAVLDHQQQRLWLAATVSQQLDAMEAALAVSTTNLSVDPSLSWPGGVTQSLQLASSQADYEAAVRQAQRYIQAGDIFQANLSLRFSTQTKAESWHIYRSLQHINPSPFASYWRTPWGSVISCSPERLVSLRGDRVETRPIAGTRSRGATRQQDQDLAQDLQANSKERAETHHARGSGTE